MDADHARQPLLDRATLPVPCRGVGAMWLYQRFGMTGPLRWRSAVRGVTRRRPLGYFDSPARRCRGSTAGESAAPLASANDQLRPGHLVSARRALRIRAGAVPWCGFGAPGACAGVPAQIQSDYTFTALVGEFGRAACADNRLRGLAARSLQPCTQRAASPASSGSPAA